MKNYLLSAEAIFRYFGKPRWFFDYFSSFRLKKIKGKVWKKSIFKAKCIEPLLKRLRLKCPGTLSYSSGRLGAHLNRPALNLLPFFIFRN